MRPAYRAFFKHQLLTSLAHILISIKGLVLIPLVIKSIGAGAYGAYTLVLTTLGFFHGISSFGAGFRYSRNVPGVESLPQRLKLFLPQFHFHVFSVAILSVLAVPLTYLVAKDETTWKVVVWLAPAYLLAFTVWSQATDYYRYTGRISYFNYSTVARPFLFVSAVLLFVALGSPMSVGGLLFFEALSIVVIGIPLSVKLVREIGWRFSVYKARELRDDVRLGFPLVVTYVIEFFLSSSDRYVLAYFMGINAVGYYNPGYALGAMLLLIPKVSGVVLPPLLSRAVDKGEGHEARTMVNYLVKGFLLVACPFVVGSYVLGGRLLALLANAEVAASGAVVPAIVALGMLFYGLTMIFANVLFVLRRTTVLLRISTVGALLNLVLNVFLLALVRDIVVPAITTAVSYFIVLVYAYRTTVRHWKVTVSGRVVGKYVVASAVMGLAVHWLNVASGGVAGPQGWVIGLILIGVGVYLGTLGLLGAFTENEIAILKRLLGRGET